MENKIYLVVCGDCNKEEICGYFSSKTNAAKYCKSKKGSKSFYRLQTCESLDETNLDGVKIQYAYTFQMDENFRIIPNNEEPEVLFEFEIPSDIYPTCVTARIEEKNLDKALEFAYSLSFLAKKDYSRLEDLKKNRNTRNHKSIEWDEGEI